MQINALIIRHAQSKFNLAQIEHIRKTKNQDFEPYWYDECPDVKFSPLLIDCTLSPKGVQQCISGKEQVQNYDVKVVFVSPLKRAIMTAIELFRDHKNQPKIVCIGFLRENLYSACDIGSNLQQIQQEFPQLDTSMIQNPTYKNFWNFDYIVDEKLKSEIQQNIEKLPEQERENQVQNVILRLMQNKFNSSDVLDRNVRLLESTSSARLRSQCAKEHILKYLTQNDLLEQVQQNQKIAVVSHYWQLNFLQAKKFNEDNIPETQISFENCQPMELKVEL